MIKILLSLLLSFATFPVHAEPAEPKGPKKVELIVSETLADSGVFCYTLLSGIEVRTDGTVPCLKQYEVEYTATDVARQFDISAYDPQWENLTIIYTAKMIDCGGTPAMGCTQVFPDYRGISVVSLYFPWRRSILRHEMTHYVYFVRDEPEFMHFCLDNPRACK